MVVELEEKKETIELLQRLSSLGNSPRYIKLLNLLLEKADKNGVAYLTSKEGAIYLDVDTRTFYRIVKKLIQTGFIQKLGTNLYKVIL